MWLLGRQAMGDMSNEKQFPSAFFTHMLRVGFLPKVHCNFTYCSIIILSFGGHLNSRQLTIQILDDKIWVACQLGYPLLHQGPVTFGDNVYFKTQKQVVWHTLHFGHFWQTTATLNEQNLPRILMVYDINNYFFFALMFVLAWTMSTSL